MKKSLSRGCLNLNDLLAGIAICSTIGAVSLGILTCEGEPVRVRRETDGVLLPTVASYFKPHGAFVESYDDEFADLLNEVWVKEFNLPISRDMRITFLDQFRKRNQNVAGYNVARTNIRIKKEYRPSEAFSITCHELGHEQCEREYISELMAYRLGTMAVIHFPQFGEETNYRTFGVTHTFLHKRINDAARFDTEDKHNLSALAALLALNQNQGSFAQAHNALKMSGPLYMSQAQIFLDYCRAQPNVADVVEVDPAGPAEKVLPSFRYRTLALDDLWHKVAHQIIEENVEFSPVLDATNKKLLKKSLKTAARFPMKSNAIFYLPPFEPIFYKEGFEVPLPFLVTPAGYDYSIPKGL